MFKPIQLINLFRPPQSQTLIAKVINYGNYYLSLPKTKQNSIQQNIVISKFQHISDYKNESNCYTRNYRIDHNNNYIQSKLKLVQIKSSKNYTYIFNSQTEASNKNAKQKLFENIYITLQNKKPNEIIKHKVEILMGNNELFLKEINKNIQDDYLYNFDTDEIQPFIDVVDICVFPFQIKSPLEEVFEMVAERNRIRHQWSQFHKE